MSVPAGEHTPPHRSYSDVLFLQNVYYTSSQQFHVGLLSPTMDDDDNKCLVDVNGRPRLIECSYAAAKRMKMHWLFTQVTAHYTHPDLSHYFTNIFVSTKEAKKSKRAAVNQVL